MSRFVGPAQRFGSLLSFQNQNLRLLNASISADKGVPHYHAVGWPVSGVLRQRIEPSGLRHLLWKLLFRSQIRYLHMFPH
ncbi:hypothetical protein L3X38_028520 [Prunus dulcis]|uniref:Uncharacterized protein n=1 Tax=Prunus dulcis TaxID=3755 RepID=A0AAD4Z257_PRUDU|nr:hypothetical protein L3X38_028520 [Prunus dulcis]